MTTEGTMADEPETKKRKPKGVVAILVGPGGIVAASVSHFARDRPGGFSLVEAQRYYAREALANEFVRAFCHQDVADCMRGYDAQQLLNRLVARKTYTIQYVEIGHDEESAP